MDSSILMYDSARKSRACRIAITVSNKPRKLITTQEREEDKRMLPADTRTAKKVTARNDCCARVIRNGRKSIRTRAAYSPYSSLWSKRDVSARLYSSA